MPPTFQSEGIDAAKELRKRHPGTGVVVLSQYDDPEYAISLLADGAAGLRVPPQGPHRRGQPARPRGARGRDRRIRARPDDRRGARAPGDRHRRPHRRRGAAAPAGRRGPADQGDRRRAAHHARPRSPRRSRALFLRCRSDASAGEAGALQAAALAAPGDRRPRRAGRDAEPAAADRARREAAPRRPQHRRDRRARRDRDHVGHPRLLGHRRDAPTRPRSRTCSTSTAPR